MSEADKWLNGAADDYYERNKKHFGRTNLVLPLMQRLELRPRRVLEVGCADGWQLEQIREYLNCDVVGVEPSGKAVKYALDERQITVCQGTAHSLHMFEKNSFDVVIYGFCLWVCEPESWFKIIAEADRVLMDGGIVIIHDFIPARAMSWPKWHSAGTSKREQECPAWLYDFKKLFLGHPLYHQIGEAIAQRVIGELMMGESAAALVKYPASVLPKISTKEDS